MIRWTGVVLALPGPGSDEMESRLATFLHPVAGRPLLWHSVAALALLHPRPERVVVVAETEVSPELFQDLSCEITVVRRGAGGGGRGDELLPRDGGSHALVVDASAPVEAERLQPLLEGPAGGWLGTGTEAAAAAWLETAQLTDLLGRAVPLLAPNGVLTAAAARSDEPPVLRVRNREQLALLTRRIRDRVVQGLMQAGVSFLLPESVLVDVDVRVGRDTVIYPGVVLEGQTTIGEETVIGPGCRIIDSWVGSGVELKGWNYVSHTSVRNRAILEPYVRRGYD